LNKTVWHAWELRTTTDLAALWASQRRSDDGRALLQPVFEQFVEGSNTADLKAADRADRPEEGQDAEGDGETTEATLTMSVAA